MTFFLIQSDDDEDDNNEEEDDVSCVSAQGNGEGKRSDFVVFFSFRLT